MSIWNKILLGCIFVTALALFVLSARTLQAHRYWRESHNQHQEALAVQEERVRELLLGDEARQANLELYKLLIGRGRVWSDCRPMDVIKDQDPATNRERVRIRVETEAPNAVASQSVLHVFADRPVAEGGSYLGRFTVANVAGTQLELHPSLQLSPAEYQRVQESQQAGIPWRLYELMPADDREVLSELAEEEIKALFPESTVAEYLMDGQIMMKSDVEQMGLRGKVVMVDENGDIVRNEQGVETEVEDGKGMYVRQLRDYEVLFDQMRRLRSTALARIEIAKRDKQFLDDALADARLQQQFRQQEIQDKQEELAGARREMEAVEAHEASLAAAIDAMQSAIDEMIAANEATLAEIARVQRDAARIINARAAGVAQSL